MQLFLINYKFYDHTFKSYSRVVWKVNFIIRTIQYQAYDTILPFSLGNVKGTKRKDIHTNIRYLHRAQIVNHVSSLRQTHRMF